MAASVSSLVLVIILLSLLLLVYKKKKAQSVRGVLEVESATKGEIHELQDVIATGGRLSVEVEAVAYEDTTEPARLEVTPEGDIHIGEHQDSMAADNSPAPVEYESVDDALKISNTENEAYGLPISLPEQEAQYAIVR